MKREDLWELRIKNVEEKDSGLFECQVFILFNWRPTSVQFQNINYFVCFCINFPPKLIQKVKCQQIFFGRKNISLRKHSFLLFISTIKFNLESLQDCVSCYFLSHEFEFALLILRARYHLKLHTFDE